MTQTNAGTGSIWNVNSWHWEQKNYTEISKKIIEEKFINLLLKPNPEIELTHTKVKFSKAEAEINIRKGKQILVYDFELELQVKAENDEEESTGSYKVKEILNDDLTDMVIEEVKANNKNKVGDELKKWLKKNIKDEVIKILRAYEADLKSMEGDPAKLEQDKKRRQEAIEATKKAREEKGAEKQRLLQEQRQREKKMKEEAYRKNFEGK